MYLLQELRRFIKSVLYWIYFLVGFSFVFFLFPAGNSFAVQIFKKIQTDLLPSGVQLIVTNPLSAFMAQVIVSLLSAFIITFPFLLFGLIKYLSPALFQKEKKAVMRVLFPSVILFFLGCIFAYLFIIPPTLKMLYLFTVAINAIPYFAVDEFVGLALNLMVAVGIMFLLPVFMKLLSSLGLVGPNFWKKNWRYALLCFLMFSAIITPDGTGITMMILVVPLSTLYGLGTITSIKRSDKSTNNK